jgi:hypothetical protein
MKKELLVFTIFLVLIVANGFGITSIGKVTPAYAASDSSKKVIPICKTDPVKSHELSVNQTYTIPENFKGNPAKFDGKCLMDNTANSTSHPCTVTHGIATAGHCEMIKIGYQVTDKGPGNIPTEEWFHLAGVTLKPGQFLDVADTTPFFTTSGHSANVLPCDKSGKPLVRLYEGILDAGVNTLESPDIEYLQQISSPQDGLCVYHFDLGTTSNNPDGVTDFAIINTSDKTVTFTDRNTETLSITGGYFNNSS